jgi:HK97 family phage major capsid protein
MANAIPLLEGTNASGGYLVPDEIGQTLQKTIQREAAVADLARVDRLVGKRTQLPDLLGPPDGVVRRGRRREAGDRRRVHRQTVLNVKKIATTVMYTEELLEDAREDPRVLVNADVEGPSRT